MVQTIPFSLYKNVSYTEGPESLKCRTVDVWISEFLVDEVSSLGYWVIFLHGGAWRDPDIDSSFAKSAIALLQNSPACKFIKGFASINYRLSSHPDHPKCPSVPGDNSRNAVHPEHIWDVIEGISYLQRRFQFKKHYILVGHSCGATLAFQTLTHRRLSNDEPESTKTYPTPPQAIVGVAGLYDLVLLKNMDPEPPVCQQFLSRAFGVNEQIWESASPVNFEYESIWDEGRVVVLARCLEDEYVSPKQLDVMEKALATWKDQEGRVLMSITVTGHHDDCWKMGYGLVESIEEALAHLQPKI